MAIEIETAVRYLSAGLSVLPAVKAKKRPAIGSWKTWSRRLPTDVEVEAWFSNGHEGLCVIAGAVSGNMECIDFDCKAEAYPAWAQKVDPALLDTLVIEKTPSGGKHVLYRSECAVAGNQKLAQGIRNGKLATLIETRGEAGLSSAPRLPDTSSNRETSHTFRRFRLRRVKACCRRRES